MSENNGETEGRGIGSDPNNPTNPDPNGKGIGSDPDGTGGGSNPDGGGSGGDQDGKGIG